MEPMLGEADIRQELTAVVDHLNATPKDQIAERSRLRAREGELRDQLKALNPPGSDATLREWNEQAGSKPPVDTGRPHVPSHGEGGQAGG